MQRDHLSKRRGMLRVVQCMCVMQLLSFLGCQPASRSAPVIETVDLPRISAATFEIEVINSPQPVLVEVAVDYGCPACEAMKPHVTKVAEQVGSDIKIVRLDHRSNREFAHQFGASVCPSYLIFNEGQLVDSILGQSSADMLLDRLHSHMPKNGSSNKVTEERGG